MRRIVLLFLLSLLPTGVAAQVRFVDCPDSMIPDHYKSYPRWSSDHVNVHPVIPELSAGDPFMVNKYVKDPTGNEPREVIANLLRGQLRLKKLAVVQAFTPAGTDYERVPSEPPADFWAAFDQATLPHNLEWVIYPCGKTLVNNLTWAEEDKVENGVSTPQVRVLGPHVVDWYEVGVVTPSGEPGFRVIQTREPIMITSGVNKGNLLRFKLIQACGNPDFDIFLPPGSTDSDITVRPTVPLVQQAEKKVEEEIKKPVQPEVPEVVMATVPPSQPRRSWNPCKGKRGILCGAAAVALVGFAAKGKQTLPPAAPYVPPTGQIKGDNGIDSPGTR